MRRTFAPLAASCLRRACSALPAAAALRAPMMAPVMALSQQARFAHDAPLCDATRRELEEELSRSGKPEQPAIPAGWTVHRTPGRCTFEMKRKYEDEEVKIYYCPREDGGNTNDHRVLATITSNNNAILFDLTIEDCELVLDNIRFCDDAKLAHDMSAEAEAKKMERYPGPAVNELDNALVDSFIKYIEKRGVNDELAEFITLYSFWAEQQEYESWLSSIVKFTS